LTSTDLLAQGFYLFKKLAQGFGGEAGREDGIGRSTQGEVDGGYADDK
jgi:hypothetical protein